MDILVCENTVNPEWWMRQLADCDWIAGQYLYTLLREDRFHRQYGEKSRVLMLADGAKLAAFCSYAERDEIPDTDLTPWLGFVYTYPDYRGRRLMGKLIARAKEYAREDGYDTLWISTGETGLYEKYGAVYVTDMKENRGGSTHVYRMDTYEAVGVRAQPVFRQVPPLQILQERDILVRKPPAELFRRIARDDRIGRDVFRHDRTRTDHGAVADRNAADEQRAGPDPDVVPDHRGRRRFFKQFLRSEACSALLRGGIEHGMRGRPRSGRMRPADCQNTVSDGAEPADARVDAAVLAEVGIPAEPAAEHAARADPVAAAELRRSGDLRAFSDPDGRIFQTDHDPFQEVPHSRISYPPSQPAVLIYLDFFFPTGSGVSGAVSSAGASIAFTHAAISAKNAALCAR